MGFLELSHKNDFWGRYGHASYSDSSVPDETKYAVLHQMGYASDVVTFHSWTGLMGSSQRGHNYKDFAPGSVQLTYRPQKLKLDDRSVKLYTDWESGRAGCTIRSVPSVASSIWIPYPANKTPGSWQEFYRKVCDRLSYVEQVLASHPWFFRTDNFEFFDKLPEAVNGCWWANEGKPVQFERVQFGSTKNSYWGTLWYFK